MEFPCCKIYLVVSMSYHMSEVDKLCTYVITSTSDFNSQILGDEKNLF